MSPDAPTHSDRQENAEGKNEVYKRYLMHERLLVRFLALLGVVLVVFVGVWALSYAFLPEGLLRGRTAAQALAGNDLAGGSVWLEWLRMLAINLGAMFFAMIAPNLLRTQGDYPLGYTSVTVNVAVFGVVLGTDSFALSLGGKIAPTLAIFESSGLYEIAAYILAVADTVSIAKWRIVGKTTEAVVPPRDRSVIRERYVGVALAIAILVIACGWEAYRFSVAIAR